MEPREYATLHALEDRFWWYRGLHRLTLERAAEALRGTGDAPLVLDAGCGTGGMVRRLRDRFPGARIHGIDMSPHALGFARASCRRLGRAGVERLPFPDRTFDLVVSLDVLYHAGVVDDLEALRELRRVLRPGGALLLNLPAFESLRSSHDRAIHTARRYRRGALLTKLRSAGLSPVRVHYWNSLLFPALAAVRWLRRPAAHRDEGEAQSDVRPLPVWIDRTLGAVLSGERRLLRLGSPPFGLSLLAWAERPGEGP